MFEFSDPDPACSLTLESVLEIAAAYVKELQNKKAFDFSTC